MTVPVWSPPSGRRKVAISLSPSSSLAPGVDPKVSVISLGSDLSTEGRPLLCGFAGASGVAEALAEAVGAAVAGLGGRRRGPAEGVSVGCGGVAAARLVAARCEDEGAPRRGADHGTPVGARAASS